jgi:hypothetical protein
MEPPRAIRNVKRIIFALSNVVFLFSWLWLCVHLFGRWHFIGRRVQGDALFLLTMAGLLWFQLLRERCSCWCLLIASFAFVAVMNIVPLAF